MDGSCTTIVDNSSTLSHCYHWHPLTSVYLRNLSKAFNCFEIFTLCSQGHCRGPYRFRGFRPTPFRNEGLKKGKKVLS